MLTPRAWAGRRLERGTFSGPLALGASAAWRRLAEPARPLLLPAGVRVVGVGGATLGGAGKTPLVLELARRLAARGEQVAVLAGSYRARPQRARCVRPHDAVERVGDEALMLARALSPLGVPVVVAPRRQAALDMAARLAPIVLVDALLQARPERLDLSLLVLDADAPWGAGRCPPSGDLRADRARLLAACDAVVLSGRAGGRGRSLVEGLCRAAGRPVFEAPGRLEGARTPDGTLLTIPELAGRRLGLTLGVAHPGRILIALQDSGVTPVCTSLHADHAAPIPAGRGPAPEAWLATAKCATKLSRDLRGVPVWVLEQALRVPGSLLDLVAPGAAPDQPDVALTYGGKPVVESAPCPGPEAS